MSDVLNVSPSQWRQDEEIKIFSDAVAQFFEKELKPHVESWREAGAVPRDVWYKAAEQGLLLVSAPEEYGGAGGDFRHDAVIIEQLELQGIAGFGIGLHNAMLRLTSFITAPKTKSSAFCRSSLRGKWSVRSR